MKTADQVDDFDPDLHFTGQGPLSPILRWLDGHAAVIHAYHLYAPLSGMYSLELMLENDADGEKIKRAFFKRFAK